MICAYNVMLLICLRIHRRSSVKNVQNQGRVLPYTHIILTSEFCPVGRFLQVCLRILPPTHVRRSHLRISSLSAVWKCRSKMRPMEGKVVVHTSRVNEHSTDKRLGQAYGSIQDWWPHNKYLDLTRVKLKYAQFSLLSRSNDRCQTALPNQLTVPVPAESIINRGELQIVFKVN